MIAATNIEVRRAARANDVPLWKLADRLGISEPTLTRWLRKELPEDRKQEFLRIIAEIAEEANTNG